MLLKLAPLRGMSWLYKHASVRIFILKRDENLSEYDNSMPKIYKWQRAKRVVLQNYSVSQLHFTKLNEI